LPKDIIFLSATFKGNKKNKNLIKKEINSLKNKKELAQPTRIKTGGSTFKNPINQTNKKVWELIKESVSLDTEFGDAAISQKHCNFFINKKNAKYDDMKKLINLVKDKVMSKTGIKLDLEIILVE
jgi:UDP-N-acetylmuramate dehydrogenase